MHPALAPMIGAQRVHRRLRRRGGDQGAELIEADPRAPSARPRADDRRHGGGLKAFHQVIEPKVRRVALIDTLQTRSSRRSAWPRRSATTSSGPADTPPRAAATSTGIVEEVRWD